MPTRGPLPKPAAQRARRNKESGDWREVPNRPYEGQSPDLPGDGWTSFTVLWWETVRAMPHCVLWSKSDWLFALESAMVAEKFAENQKDYAGELRMRGKVLGLTDDDRRRLQIRYVDPDSDDGLAGENVTQMSDYRELYEDR